jgi:hypothetical protein
MKKVFVLFALVLGFVSCQKVIDVDLNEANPVIVIEANYTGEDSTVNVHISRTSSYFNSDPSATVDAAVVTITDQQGNTTVIPSIGNGDYQLTAYIPNYDTQYTLTVTQDGQTYTAMCYMGTPVALEDITYEYFPGFFGSDPGYAVFLNFYDPAGIQNYYQVIITENGVELDKLDDIFTQDDLLTDGNLVERPLFSGDFYDIGDTVEMELRSVDKMIYDYTNEAASIAGGGSSSAPGNPTTNWDNGALGYFNAYGNSRKSVVIQ